MVFPCHWNNKIQRGETKWACLFPIKTLKLYNFNKKTSFGGTTQWQQACILALNTFRMGSLFILWNKNGGVLLVKGMSCPLKAFPNPLRVFELWSTFLDCINPCSECGTEPDSTGARRCIHEALWHPWNCTQLWGLLLRHLDNCHEAGREEIGPVCILLQTRLLDDRILSNQNAMDYSLLWANRVLISIFHLFT